MNTILWKCKIP